MMLRRLLAILMAAFLVFAVSACGDDDTATTDDDTETSADDTDTSTDDSVADDDEEEEAEGEEGAVEADGDLQSEIAAEFLSQADDSFPLTEDQANCLGNGIVDEIGEDKLEELGLVEDGHITDNDLDTVNFEEPEAEVLADLFLDCADMQELFISSIAAETGDLDDETRECLEGVLSEDAIREFLVVGFTGGDEDTAIAQLFGDAEGCVATDTSEG